VSSKKFRFDGWVLDSESGDLERSGTRVRLQEQPALVLRELITHAGSVVTREQLIAVLWPKGVVDFDTGLNTAIRKLRSALGDTAETPRYIETLPRRGYRFLGSVDPDPGAGAASLTAPVSTVSTASPGPTPPSHHAPTALPEAAVAQDESGWLKDKKEERIPSVSASVAAGGAAAVGSPSATPPAPSRPPKWVPLGWIGGTLSIVILLAASWAIVHYRGANKPAEQTSSGAAPAAIHSLAVLPLENLSGDKEQEYFADGMTDALITNLAQIGSLRVISRTSAMHFKGSKETLPQISRDLQVDAVVEGTVARGEHRVRITAQLIQASTDHNLWARTYERDLKDALALQDEITQDITEQIRVKLSPKERSVFRQVNAVDPEAYDELLKGRYWLSSWTSDRAWRALDYFQKAIAKDPKYALAYAGVADSFVTLVVSGGLPPKEAWPKAKEAAEKALALDPSLAEARTSLAFVKFGYEWDWSGAEAEFKQAIALSPNYATAHLMYSGFFLAMERLDEAMKEIERARDLDPFSPGITWWLGQVLYHARRYDDALRQDWRGLEMHPDNANFYDAMADVYEQKKMFAEAFAARQQVLRLGNDPSVTALAEAYQRSGYRGYLLKLAQIREQTHPTHQYALLNDEARAMTALEWSYDERDPGILTLRTAPELDSIRSSPRFRDLVRRIGFPPSSNDKN
jgi:TolB-like protein/DNA-binding winged helix-turn-helix (wHTH) protein/Tfp pilus assembly protein PilF